MSLLIPFVTEANLLEAMEFEVRVKLLENEPKACDSGRSVVMAKIVKDFIVNLIM